MDSALGSKRKVILLVRGWVRFCKSRKRVAGAGLASEGRRLEVEIQELELKRYVKTYELILWSSY
jgi:hypothetical protein